MPAIQTLAALGLAALIGAGCDATPRTVAQGMDAAALDAAALDAAALDAAALDAAALDAAALIDLPDLSTLDARIVGPDLALDRGPRDMGGPDGTPRDSSVDADPCGAEACNDADDDCDGLIDEGEACVDAALAGCWVRLEVTDSNGESAGSSSSGDGLFHGFGPPGDVDAGDTLSIAWRCDPALAWAEAGCRILLAHAEGSGVIACPGPGCVSTAGDGQPAALRFEGDVDGDDRFGVGFVCADAQRPARAAVMQARLRVWIATQHRRVDADGACLDEPRHVRVPEWGFCPGDPVDDEGRHRCASSDGDGAVHAFGVGTVGGIWPDLGPCDTFGVALTR